MTPYGILHKVLQFNLALFIYFRGLKVSVQRWRQWHLQIDRDTKLQCTCVFVFYLQVGHSHNLLGHEKESKLIFQLKHIVTSENLIVSCLWDWPPSLVFSSPLQPWTPPSRCGNSYFTCWMTSSSAIWSPGQVRMENSNCWMQRR